MPTLAEKLTPSSSKGQISAAISDTIAHYMDKGRPQDQAVRIAYEQASKATGKELGRKRD